MKFYHIAICLCAALPAQAATLRTMTSLPGARVYLRDLFDDAGENANRVLGSGPGPGGRIVVEARQLKAIARQFGVEWEPMSSGDRAVLEWSGRPLRKEEVMIPLRAALIAQGASEECQIEIPGFTPPVVPASGIAAPLVTHIDYDRDMGRFTAILSVMVDGMEPIVTRVGGQVAEMTMVPVAVTRMTAGSIPRAGDVRMQRVHVSAIHNEIARDPAAVIGMQLKRPLSPGAPIAIADLMRPTQVTRGEPVRLRLEANGLSVAGEGIALESGAEGEKIRVRNTTSQAVLEAVIMGSGVVRVLPGTAPISSQARLGLSGARGG